ncbi:hypothetical protein TNCT_686361 [Trichonephila clavata]|uniref:Uncharacterized protein n=1 Tax=Trichonephila clavata TaxID=2740835 RepID=A0A8X6LUC4_TRICU|nr:hypothetical protein TNCT_686361 [Trichonephila clavata]
MRGKPGILTVPSGVKEDICKDSIGHFLPKLEKQCHCQRLVCKEKPKSYRGKCDFVRLALDLSTKKLEINSTEN